jgi:pyridinium-3,5-biscarboxylic acid mononucleotide sulfurtransferase
MTPTSISRELTKKHTALVQKLASLESLLVAYSGGTDSAYLAFVAHACSQ